MRPLVAAFLVLTAAIVGPGPLQAQPAEAQLAEATQLIRVDWTMPDRFGVDVDGDRRIDLPNTHAYTHNRIEGSCDPCPEPRFEVRLSANRVPIGVVVPVRLYTWTIDAAGWDAPLEYHRIDRHLDLLLPEGDYRVEVGALLDVPWGKVVARDVQTIRVSDILIVSIGDSYASGEGNPEVPREGSETAALWGDGATPYAESLHAATRRSTVAWPARAAMYLEQGDRHSSVTFVSVAASGARIDNGMIRGREDRASQIQQVADLVGHRTVDLLLIQAGGNSVGFSRFIRALVEADPLLDPVCYHLMIEQAVASVEDGDWSRDTRVRFSLPWKWSCRATSGRGARLPGIEGLAAAFDRLDSALASLDYQKAVLVGYPDPTGADDSGKRCREIVGDVTPPLRFHEVSREEGRLGVNALLTPLNEALKEAAERQGWLFADGVPDAFAAGHGYCAPWPDYGYPEEFDDLPGFVATELDFPDGWYRNPGPGTTSTDGAGITWYRTAGQSAVLQGPAAPFATSGTLHPNEIGHDAIARIVLATLGD